MGQQSPKKKSGSSSRTGLAIVLIVIIVATSVALYSSYFNRTVAASTSTTTGISTITSSSVQSSQSISNSSSHSSLSLSSTSQTNSSAKAVIVLIPYGTYSNQKLNFEPADLKIVIGVNNTVIWMNKDYTLHTISTLSSPTNSSSFQSTPVFQGGSFEYTFTVPGTYLYYCPWHPGWMRGTITVIQLSGKS